MTNFDLCTVMIYLWSENLLFFIFKKSDTAFKSALMACCTNVIGTLFYFFAENSQPYHNFFFLLDIFDIYFFLFLWSFGFLLLIYCSLISGFVWCFIFFLLFFISAISRYWHFSYSSFTSVFTCFGALWHLILDVRFCRYFCYHPVSLVRSYHDFLTAVLSFLEGHNVFFFG